MHQSHPADNVDACRTCDHDGFVATLGNRPHNMPTDRTRAPTTAIFIRAPRFVAGSAHSAAITPWLGPAQHIAGTTVIPPPEALTLA